MKSQSWILIFIVAICVAGVISFFLLMSMGLFAPERDTISLGSKIGLVEVTGTIVSPSPVVDDILRFARDDAIKAVIVRIESPGGVVAPAQEIYEALKKLRSQGKPVVASMGSVAASGGYYVACGADSIVADPGTLTGSIGVIMSFPNTQELFKKLGIDVQVVKTGEFKDTGSPTRPMTTEEKQLIGELIGDVYDQFVTVVATERRMSLDAVKKIADGRVLTGRQAYRLGLVDRLGGYRDAVMLAGELAGIKGEPVVVKHRKPRTSILDLIDQLSGFASKVTRDGVSMEYSLR
ncbi:MAG TPA: signal peptide peptidase SppA [bacterium]|nr:signal peptide peptidase SppA [bacterium]